MDKKLKLANVELHLPADELMASPLRLLVSGLASRLGFTLDELDDLKLTLGEAFLAVVDKCKGQCAGAKPRRT
jgi:serine/threonine-protein kinase RsbW